MSALPFPRVAILGSGALGLYYGGRLGLGGAAVSFLMRSDLDAVKRRGSVRIHESSGTLELSPVHAYRSSAEIGRVDLVVVCLKATANRELGGMLPPLLDRETCVLTLQNGLGTDEYVAGLVGGQRVVGGLAFIASTRTGPGEVSCYHPGSVTIGEFARSADDRANLLVGQFEAAGVRMDVSANLLEARWRKLVWNVPFNGLAVAHDATTDLLCADPALAAEVRALMAEVQRAAAAFGFVIPDEFLDQQFEVTPPMGPYQPSSLVDFRAGREVEVEAIWGEPLRRARAKGVPVPRLEALYAKLKAVTP